MIYRLTPRRQLLYLTLHFFFLKDVHGFEDENITILLDDNEVCFSRKLSFTD